MSKTSYQKGYKNMPDEQKQKEYRKNYQREYRKSMTDKTKTKICRSSKT